jgi:hypothetical protein
MIWYNLGCSKWITRINRHWSMTVFPRSVSQFCHTLLNKCSVLSFTHNYRMSILSVSFEKTVVLYSNVELVMQIPIGTPRSFFWIKMSILITCCFLKAVIYPQKWLDDRIRKCIGETTYHSPSYIRGYMQRTGICRRSPSVRSNEDCWRHILHRMTSLHTSM